MKVRDIMTSEGLATATLETTLAEIAVRMRDENVGAIPVVDDDDKLVGIITDRDIVVRAIAAGEDPSDVTAEDVLSEQLHIIHPEAGLEEAADLMARHQIRRLPVVEDEVIVGMISLGDLAVKAEEDEASSVLEDVSEGVRESSRSGEGRRREPSGTRQKQSQDRGVAARPGSVESQFNVAGAQSPGERVAQEETQYETQRGRQIGGSRGEKVMDARKRNKSESLQTTVHEIEEIEGDEIPEFEPTGAGNRQRGSQQQAGARSRQSQSARGRESGPVRGEGTGRSGRTQGAGNRSQREESRRQQKVTPMRAEGRGASRSKSKRKAS